MSLKLFGVFCFVSAVFCEEITKKSDSHAAGADFVPQFQPFQFPPQPVFGAPQDLTALQQTHVLGNFHHRFHPTRLTPQFGPSPPLVFTPQTHILPLQPTIVQDGSQLQQTLVPPQPSAGHHEGLRPPAQQEAQPAGLVPPPNHNFKTLPTQKPTFPTNDLSIKNAFPSNSPHTIKFSISSLNYNPNQQPVKHSSQPNSQSGRFVASQAQQNRPIINQPSNNFQQQNFAPPELPKIQQNNFQNINFRKPDLPQQNFNVPSKPTFTTTNSQGSSQFQVNIGHSNRPQQNDPSSVSIVPSVGNVNSFKTRPTDSQSKFTQTNFGQTSFGAPGQTQSSFGASGQTQSSFGASGQTQSSFGASGQAQSSFIAGQTQSSFGTGQSQFAQQQFVQPNFDFSQSQQLNLLHPTQQTQFQPTQHTQFQPTQQFIQPSAQPTFKFAPTEPPREPLRQQEPTRIAQTQSFVNEKEIVFQKSHEQPQYTFSDGFPRNQHPNEISPSPSPSPSPRPSPTTPETYTTLAAKYRKPKPIVKEITINLNDKKVTGDVPAQLYIKEDRQKELLEIKEQNKGKKEKTQEDIINEQIHKLLQSHNLEIIDKDNDSQSESQEAQLAQFSEQFKKKYNYSVQLVNGGSLLKDVKPKRILTTLPPLPELPEHIKKQYEIKLVNREELFKQYDLPGNHKLGNDSSVFLANGQQLELVKFSKDGVMNKIPISGQTTTAKPPKVLFEELKQGVLPPGADYELIKQNPDGQVEKVTDLAGAKKVTFVFLEEQPDGSVKVQGVKGNTNHDTEENETVNSVLKKIKDGSLKLPPSKGIKSLYRNERPKLNPVTQKTYVTLSPVTQPTPRSIQNFPSTHAPFYERETEVGPTTDFSYSSPYGVDIDATLSPTAYYETTPEPPTTFVPTVSYVRPSTRKTKTRSRVTFLPTVPSVDPTATFGSKKIKATTAKSTSLFKNFVSSRKTHKPYPKAPKHEESEILSYKPSEYTGQRLRVPQEDVVAEESNIESVRPLNEILKDNDLHEMAKFLDQSGLDTILNETGPYTIFIPTDKAFRTLEDQLGGPEKAEDKFRENPRLLSGLLLHHVVPGSFRLEDLQDEMTGVSLAGTQLRVNTYEPEEKGSQGERIVTINGAKVSNGKKDIYVPQGLAHAIDRVLFPLPVGDIVQTLRGDRERRFTKFLKSLESSGLTDMLTGTKTYTVFAPTDKAFSVLTDSELDKLLTRREAARTIVLRHVVPGTLYSAGMNYYQVKESMEQGQKIVIKKESDIIKANSAQIVSANIPATNGVVHAVETLL